MVVGGLYLKVADFSGLIHWSYSVVLFSGLIIACLNFFSRNSSN